MQTRQPGLKTAKVRAFIFTAVPTATPALLGPHLLLYYAGLTTSYPLNISCRIEGRDETLLDQIIASAERGRHVSAKSVTASSPVVGWYSPDTGLLKHIETELILHPAGTSPSLGLLAPVTFPNNQLYQDEYEKTHDAIRTLLLAGRAGLLRLRLLGEPCCDWITEVGP